MIDSSAGNKTLENAPSFTRSLPSKSEGIALCSALILSSVLITAGNLLALVLFAITKPFRRKSFRVRVRVSFLLHFLSSSESSLYASVPVLLGLTVVICVCNIAIWRNFQHESVDSQHRNGASRNRRLTKALLLVSILALLCWLPLIILNILIYITKTSIPSKFYHMVNVLNYSNSFVNPIVYVFRITEFQQALRSCCTKRRPAIKMVKTERRNRKVALRTPDIELRILRNDPNRLQVEVEREYMETKL